MTVTALSGLLLLPFWGRFADRFGNVQVIKITSKLVVLTPILWLFSRNSVYLIVANAFAGYVWAGFNLASINFIFDAASKEVRTRCFAYFNLTNGIFIFFGATFGGYLATHLPGIIHASSLLTLFLLSGILRLLVVLFFRDKFKEVREVEKINSKEIYHAISGLRYTHDLLGKLFFQTKKIQPESSEE